jgi:hypothetical protein
VRVCIVYDCLYPYTIGGAERWYRNVAERLAEAGHDVTFLTLRQWEHGTEPDIPGVRVVAAGRRMALYTRSGRRRLLPPVVFGIGVLGHLLRKGRRYDVVHTASFPYFSLLAAAASSSTGTRCGHEGTGANTPDRWPAESGGPSSERAFACRSAPSASRPCTKIVSASSGSAAS